MSERTYSFADLVKLNNAATDKARHTLTCDLFEHDLQYIIDGAKDDGALYGFDIDDIHYSVGGGQGDGACWVGRVDMDKWIELEIPQVQNLQQLVFLQEFIRNEVICSSTNIRRYSTTRYPFSCNMMCDGFEADTSVPLRLGIMAGAHPNDLLEGLGITLEEMAKGLCEAVEAHAREFADDVFKQLQDEYEYLCSDAHLIDMAEANDWRFDADGRLIVSTNQ